MIAGEALVFFIIIAIGGIYVIRAYRKEIKLFNRQTNFTLSVTHELKTPIASSKLFLETLLSRDLTLEKQRELIRKVLSDQDRLQKLVDNILMASKVAENDLELVFEEVKLYDFIKDICEEFPPSHKVINNINHDELIKVDPFYFTSVIQNLFENAQKYSPLGSNIEWSFQKMNGRNELTIIDEGKGIPDAEKNKIFDMFYRLDEEETRNSKGTGLGLYLVKNIVQLHQGQIFINESKKRGSEFVIKF